MTKSDHLQSAMQDAIEAIEYLQSLEVLSRGPTWTRLWFALEFAWSSDEPKYVTMPVSADEKLATEARQSHEAFEFAKWLVSTRLRAGALVPTQLGILIAEWITGSWEAPAKKRGPSVATNWDRDFMFRHALDIVVERHDIPATQNRRPNEETQKKRKETGYRSGVEIVQTAFREMGISVPGSTRLENIVTDRALIDGYEETRSLILGDEFENLDPEPRI